MHIIKSSKTWDCTHGRIIQSVNQKWFRKNLIQLNNTFFRLNFQGLWMKKSFDFFTSWSMHSRKFHNKISFTDKLIISFETGNIDVGYSPWKRTILVTFRMLISDLAHIWNMSVGNHHQHKDSVTNIPKLAPIRSPT